MRVVKFQIKPYFLFVLCALSFPSFSQDLVTDILNENPFTTPKAFTESIEMISRSKRIFILSNTNQLLNKGDYITLVLNEKDPVARAIVAKNSEGRSGIKILRIYSLKRWSLMQRNLDVGIVKGDDSRLFVKEDKKELKKEENPQEDLKIDSEQDLYSLADMSDTDFEDQSKRHIKPDNLVSLSWRPYTIRNTISNQDIISNQINLAWGYQFSDNFWAEGTYGFARFDDFPATKVQTVITELSARIKYAIKAPLYTYFFPFVGYQTVNVDSPKAADLSVLTVEEAQRESELINSLKESDLLFGATMLRRLVPGWFVKLELDNNGYNVGVAIEF